MRHKPGCGNCCRNGWPKYGSMERDDKVVLFRFGNASHVGFSADLDDTEGVFDVWAAIFPEEYKGHRSWNGVSAVWTRVWIASAIDCCYVELWKDEPEDQYRLCIAKVNQRNAEIEWIQESDILLDDVTWLTTPFLEADAEGCLYQYEIPGTYDYEGEGIRWVRFTEDSIEEGPLPAIMYHRPDIEHPNALRTNGAPVLDRTFHALYVAYLNAGSAGSGDDFADVFPAAPEDFEWVYGYSIHPYEMSFARLRAVVTNGDGSDSSDGVTYYWHSASFAAYIDRGTIAITGGVITFTVTETIQLYDLPDALGIVGNESGGSYTAFLSSPVSGITAEWTVTYGVFAQAIAMSYGTNEIELGTETSGTAFDYYVTDIQVVGGSPEAMSRTVTESPYVIIGPNNYDSRADSFYDDGGAGLWTNPLQESPWGDYSMSITGGDNDDDFGRSKSFLRLRSDKGSHVLHETTPPTVIRTGPAYEHYTLGRELDTVRDEFDWTADQPTVHVGYGVFYFTTDLDSGGHDSPDFDSSAWGVSIPGITEGEVYSPESYPPCWSDDPFHAPKPHTRKRWATIALETE